MQILSKNKTPFLQYHIKYPLLPTQCIPINKKIHLETFFQDPDQRRQAKEHRK